jgi:uncharacterized protein (TIGR03067 family)
MAKKNQPPQTAPPEKTAEEIAQQSGVVQFLVQGMGTDEDFERRIALEKLLGEALTRAGLGSCDGGDGGSGTMNVFLGITDPPAARQLILQLLTQSGNAADTVVAYSDNAETGQYDVWWPEDYPYRFTIFGPMWGGPLPDTELAALSADLRALQGLWRVTRYDAPDGTRFSPWWEKVRVTIVRDRMTLRHGVGIISDARFVLQPQANPKQIDMLPTIGNNRGGSAFGVYQLGDDTFEFCVSSPDEDRPAALLPEADHQAGRLILHREPLPA